MVIELIVTLTHSCGAAVEAGGVALYALARRAGTWTRSKAAGMYAVLSTALYWARRAFLAFCGMFFIQGILGYVTEYVFRKTNSAQTCVFGPFSIPPLVPTP